MHGCCQIASVNKPTAIKPIRYDPFEVSPAAAAVAAGVVSE
jgi:hypothetical protein